MAAEAVKVLVFSCGHLRMGAYAGDVSAVIDAEAARGRGIELVPLSALIGMDRHSEARETNVLILKNSIRGILIGPLEEMAEVAPDEVLPLPRSITRCEGLAPYIGGIVRDDGVILVVDMRKIASIKETA